MKRPRAPRVVVATGNPGKLREFRTILAGQAVELCSLEAFGDVAMPPEGSEYQANAVAKARSVAAQTGEWALGDDSGLEVEGLEAAPGPFSARYGGPGLDDAGRAQHLLDELAARPGASRRARFVCVAALASPDGELEVTRGECEGSILEAARGEGGFGYDPIFRPEGRECSMAELDVAEKDAISHRARALGALVQTSSWARRLST